MMEDDLDLNETSNEAVSLVRKPNTKSVVWNYFGVPVDDRNNPTNFDKPVCRICKTTVPAKRSNTSNLFRHLQDHHIDVYSQLDPATIVRKSRLSQRDSQITIAESFSRTKQYDRGSKRAKELNRAVMVYLANDMQPFYTVDKKGFRDLLEKLDPRYKLPTRRHFVDYEFPALYSEVKEMVICAMSGVKYYSGTTDLWTSTSNHPYLSLTIHFINQQWELHSFCLDTVPLFKDHTGETIADAIQDILLNWGLSVDNLVATTTDNGSNFVRAFNSVLQWPRISCFGHNLDLSINKGLKIDLVQHAVSRCHALVAVFSRSWKKTRDLKEKQLELHIEQHKLLSDVETRWGSTYLMVERSKIVRIGTKCHLSKSFHAWKPFVQCLNLWQLLLMHYQEKSISLYLLFSL